MERQDIAAVLRPLRLFTRSQQAPGPIGAIEAPEGSREWRQAERYADELRGLCARYGLEGLWPAEGNDNVPPTARGIFEANLGLIRSADAVIADISPFRGPHVDDGTAWEIGFAYALGKPVFVWTDDPEPLAWRIDGWRSPDAHLRDREGYLIEDFAAPANLMIVGACHSISVTPEDAVWAAARHFRTYLRSVSGA